MIRFLSRILLLAILIFNFSIASSQASDNAQNSIFEMYIQKQIVLKDNKGMLRAIVADDREYVKKQLVDGANPDMKFGNIPMIFFPVYLNNAGMSDLILSFGANPDTSVMGVTPVSFAIYRKSNSSLETLIKNGANVNLKTLGSTPLDFAISCKNYKAIEILINNGATPSDKNIKSIYKLKQKFDNAKLE